VRPHALQSRKEVLQLGEFDLKAGFTGPRPRRKNVQNQLRAVHDSDPQFTLEVLGLVGLEVIIEDDQIGTLGLDKLAQLHDLPRPDEGVGMVTIEALDQGTDPLPTGCVEEAVKLLHVLFHFPGGHLLERGAHQDGALDRVAVIQKLRRDGSKS
jgi:hypothetical protein